MEILIAVVIWLIILSIMKDSKALVWRVLFFFVSFYLLFLIFVHAIAEQLVGVIK